jgi:uncharacterized protein (DUF433 family)
MMPVEVKMNRIKIPTQQIKSEMRGGELYEYFPLGKHVVAAPGVCGGRPTFKYTRLEVSVILSRIASGETIEEVARAYSLSQITPEAVQEAIQLAGLALVHSTEMLQPVAA